VSYGAGIGFMFFASHKNFDNIIRGIHGLVVFMKL
jgi:hypothetical protein